MTDSRRPAVAVAPVEQPLERFERLLDAHRDALAAGDPAAIEQASRQLQSLLSDADWRRAVARSAAPSRLRAALASAAINAALAARGDSHAARSLAALGLAPSLYTATGGLGGTSGRGASARGVSA
jgi:hypothetical protein